MPTPSTPARTRAEPGLVTGAFGRYCTVTPAAAGPVIRAHGRGKRADAVCGDRVWVQRSPTAPDTGVIERIEPRRNALLRQDEARTKVFAANLDAVLFMVAARPEFSDALLGRALIACEAAQIAVTIALNKIDLPEAAAARARLAGYRALGYDTLELSAKHGGAGAALLARLRGKTTLVLGGSGVGKSTLINALVPGARAATQEVSDALNSGRHTTTATVAYALPQGGWLMDSPGFQSFGLQHLSASQLAAAFPEFRALHGQCKFYNCTHRHEPGCAVLAAVQSGAIAAHRHALYSQVLAELQTPAW